MLEPMDDASAEFGVLRIAGVLTGQPHLNFEH